MLSPYVRSNQTGMPDTEGVVTMTRYVDSGSFVTAVITLVLFLAALFSKGLTHDLFLEAGVFLVSVKIIIMGYTNSQAIKNVESKVDQVLLTLQEREHR